MMIDEEIDSKYVLCPPLRWTRGPFPCGIIFPSNGHSVVNGETRLIRFQKVFLVNYLSMKYRLISLSTFRTWLWIGDLNLYSESLYMLSGAVLRIFVSSTLYQSYLDLEAGDTQSLKSLWRDPVPRALASQKLNFYSTAAYGLSPDVRFSVGKRFRGFFLKCYKNEHSLKYVIGLDLLNCHAKFRGDTISRSRENDVWSCYFVCSFPDISELKLSLPSWVMEGRMWRCKAVRLAELPFLYFL